MTKALIFGACTGLSPAPTLVLDGEVAIFDQQLRSRFDWLRRPDPEVVATPPVYMIDDPWHDGLLSGILSA